MASENEIVDLKQFDHFDFNGPYRVNMWIPTENVGKVIGKKGTVIHHISLTSQSDVTVVSLPSTSDKTPAWTAVSIVGKPSHCHAAYGLVKDLVDEVDDIVLEFPLPRAKIYHGYFYGAISPLFQRLSADHNVRIYVPERGGTNNSITLEGQPDNVYKVLAQFISVMSDESFRSPPAPSSALLSTTIDIPIAILGLLLTKKVSLNILSQIKQYTSTEIQKIVKKENDNIGSDVERFVITGHIQEKLDLAVHTLQRIINGVNIGVVMRELKATAIAKGYYKHAAEEKVVPKRKEVKPKHKKEKEKTVE